MSTITVRRYDDESTTELFKFVFYCEHCGKIVSTYESTSNACYTPKLFENPAKRRAQELLWLNDHKAAFVTASKEALKKLNRCENCGSLVCDNCSDIDDKDEGNLYCHTCMHAKYGK